MCSLPPFPSLPTSNFDPCSIITAGSTSCPITYPDPAGLPIWAVQVILWALIELPLGELACSLSGLLTGIQLDINNGLTTLASLLNSFFQGLQSSLAWTGIWAPVAASVIVGAFIFGALALVFWIVDALEDAEHLAVELA